MVVIDRWSLYRNTVSNNPSIKWSIGTASLKKWASQIWCENYLGQNQPFTKFVEDTNNLTKLVEAALEFQHFLQWQIKCWGSYMKMHFALAFPWQCFCWGWQDFILRALAFTLATLAKTLTRSKLVRLLPFFHISPRIRCIMCTIIVAQILLYKYCYMQCNVLFSHIKS